MSLNLEENLACPICGSGDTVELRGQPEDFEYQVDIASNFSIRACQACRTEYVSPGPSLDELRAMYPESYYAYGAEMGGFWQIIYNWWCRSEAKRLLKLSARRPLHLFDIGAGDCRRFKAMGSRDQFRFSGIEMNAEMAQAACEEGFNIFPGTFEEYEPADSAGTVDVLTINHVIEHVTDPLETLRKAHVLLADDGIFTGRTPKVDCSGRKWFGRFWGGYHYPRHLHIFSRESMELLLHKAGFRNVEITEEANLFPALSLQNFLLGKLGLPLALEHGHTRLWTLLVFLTAPLSFLDYFTRRSDCMIFVARK